VKNYSKDRLDTLTRLLIAAVLVQRYRQLRDPWEMADEKAKEVAQARGWRNLQDTIGALGNHSSPKCLQTSPWRNLQDTIGALGVIEEHLVTPGKAALIDHEVLMAAYLDDQDDGSYSDAFDDVQRRVDMAEENPDLFAQVGIGVEYLEPVKRLLQDARTFHLGRETLGETTKKLTYQRDLAFSLILLEVKRLQAVLEAAFVNQPQLLDRIHGKYWKHVDSLGRKRRKQPQQTDAVDGGDETGETGETG
jgi:hypothetical protein